MTSYAFKWKNASTLADAQTHLHNQCEALIYKRKGATGEDTEAIAEALSDNHGCRAIDYCRNKAGHQGMTALAQIAMTPLNSLSVMCIHSNSIGIEGARALARALSSSHCKLSEIFLGNNNIQDEGAQAIAEALYPNRHIRALYLARNNITDVGGRACADAIKVSPSIRLLQLRQEYQAGAGLNTVSAEIIEEIRETIKANIARQKQALRELLGKNGAPWMRSKLMVIGQGRAGKTATIRSLTCEKFLPEMESTLGAHLTQTKASAGAQGWSQLNESTDVIGAFTRRYVTKRMLEGAGGPSTERPKEAVRAPNRASQVECGNEEVSGELTQVQMPQVVESIKEKFEGIKLLYDKSDDYDLSFSIWDYGGQRVFYTLHHLFLTEFGVYLLVVDMCEVLKNKEEALQYLKFWVNSTKLHAPSAPVVLVGTRMDKVNTEEQLQNVNETLLSVLQDKFPQVVVNKGHSLTTPDKPMTFFPIDNTNAKGADEIRQQVEAVAREADFVNQHVALSWVKFIDTLLNNKAKWMKIRDVEVIARDCGITAPEEMDALLSFFHEIGSVVYFTSTQALRDIVTLSPQWLVDSISKVIRDDKLHRFNPKNIERYQLEADVELLFTKALATRDLLEYVWNNEQVQFMLDLMKHTLLLSGWEFKVAASNEELYLVPCMLRSATVDTSKYEGKYSVVYDFSGHFLPDGLYERLLCICVAHSATVDGAKEPMLAAGCAAVWLDRDSIIVLKLELDKICVHFSNSKKIHVAFRLLNAVLQKIKIEVMNARLEWDTILHDKRKGKTCTLQAAKKKKLSPWFATWRQSKEMSAATAVAMFNIGVFDAL